MPRMFELFFITILAMRFYTAHVSYMSVCTCLCYKHLATAIISITFVYFNSLFCTMSSKDVSKLQRVQHCLAREFLSRFVFLAQHNY